MMRSGEPLTSPNTKQKIIDIARTLMMEKGVADTSLSDIAKAAGISRGTLYYYYPSKSGLVCDITEQHFNSITEKLVSWIDSADKQTTPEEILKVVFETILKQKTRTKLHLYLLQDAALNNPQTMAYFREKYKEWRLLIENELNKVFAGNCDRVRARSFIILAALDGLIIQTVVGSETIPLEEIVEYLSLN